MFSKHNPHLLIKIKMNKREIFKAMLENQVELNKTAYSETWFEKGTSGEWNYLVAASQEIAEFTNSYWLPWWSKAERDMVNCRIELVDAAHFMLSQVIIYARGDLDLALVSLEASYENMLSIQEPIRDWLTLGEENGAKIDPVIACTRLVQHYLNETPAAEIFAPFFLLCKYIDFSVEQMFSLYMGKSELNKFRQKHGYKQGTYTKKWDGKNEDNHFLSLWVVAQEVPPSAAQISEWLELEYSKHQQEKNDNG